MAQMEMPETHYSQGYSSTQHQVGGAGLAQLNQAVGSSAGMDYSNVFQNPPAVRAAALVARGIDRSLAARPQPKPQEETMTGRRLVQVFIVDPDPNMPLDGCLLYRGELQLTDLTDQELFYEIDIKQMLDAHNVKRTLVRNKAVKEREEKLEPARIRDLRMQIVLVAQF